MLRSTSWGRGRSNSNMMPSSPRLHSTHPHSPCSSSSWHLWQELPVRIAVISHCDRGQTTVVFRPVKPVWQGHALVLFLIRLTGHHPDTLGYETKPCFLSLLFRFSFIYFDFSYAWLLATRLVPWCPGQPGLFIAELPLQSRPWFLG